MSHDIESVLCCENEKIFLNFTDLSSLHGKMRLLMFIVYGYYEGYLR